MKRIFKGIVSQAQSSSGAAPLKRTTRLTSSKIFVFLIALCIWTIPVQEASAAANIARDQQGSTHSDLSGTTLSYTLNPVAAGALIVVGVTWGSASSTCTVSDGTSYTPLFSKVTSGVLGIQAFYLVNASAGSHTITMTTSSSNSYLFRIKRY